MTCSKGIYRDKSDIQAAQLNLRQWDPTEYVCPAAHHWDPTEYVYTALQTRVCGTQAYGLKPMLVCPHCVVNLGLQVLDLGLTAMLTGPYCTGQTF